MTLTSVASSEYLWIGGKAVESASESQIPVINPATEETIKYIPKGSKGDVIKAVDTALAAFPEWSGEGPAGRRTYLLQAAAKIEQHKNEIASILTSEHGKPLSQSLFEIGGTMNLLREFAEMAVQYRVGSQGAPQGEMAFQRWEPRGVAGCIAPWNFPLLVAMETLAPNLAVGNTVVIKPSEKTPLSLRYLVEVAFNDFPPGVVNVVLGDGPNCGDALVHHPDVEVVMFVGSERTGKAIGEICGSQVKKAVLELGGKDACIVDGEVDVQKAAELVADCCFANTGQICTSTERVYVQKEIFDEFVQVMKKIAENSRLGSGEDDQADYGPLIDDLQLKTVESHVEEALQDGAELVAGGKRPEGPGYFYPPTVLVLPPESESSVICKETFGPVAPLVPVDSFEEGIQLANKTKYGLGAVVCTNNANHALQAMQELRAGMVRINSKRGKVPGSTSEPFGLSGIGHGYGKELLQELTRQKSIQWRKV